jgi:hypothetical protein
VHVGSLAVGSGADGWAVGVSVGEGLGRALGAIDGVGGDGVLRGEPDGVWTEGVPVHDASMVASAAARTTRWPGTRLEAVPADERSRGLSIVDVVTRKERPRFQPRLAGLSTRAPSKQRQRSQIGSEAAGHDEACNQDDDGDDRACHRPEPWIRSMHRRDSLSCDGEQRPGDQERQSDAEDSDET